MSKTEIKETINEVYQTLISEAMPKNVISDHAHELRKAAIEATGRIVAAMIRENERVIH